MYLSINLSIYVAGTWYQSTNLSMLSAWRWLVNGTEVSSPRHCSPVIRSARVRARKSLYVVLLFMCCLLVCVCLICVYAVVFCMCYLCLRIDRRAGAFFYVLIVFLMWCFWPLFLSDCDEFSVILCVFRHNILILYCTVYNRLMLYCTVYNRWCVKLVVL